MPQEIVVEWAPFRTRLGVSDEALVAASDALQRDFLAQQPGFLSRELLRGADGQWTDLVFWKDRRSVDAAMQRVADSAACSRYFALMDLAEHTEAGVQLLGRIKRYGDEP